MIATNIEQRDGELRAAARLSDPSLWRATYVQYTNFTLGIEQGEELLHSPLAEANKHAITETLECNIHLLLLPIAAITKFVFFQAELAISSFGFIQSLESRRDSWIFARNNDQLGS